MFCEATEQRNRRSAWMSGERTTHRTINTHTICALIFWAIILRPRVNEYKKKISTALSWYIRLCIYKPAVTLFTHTHMTASRLCVGAQFCENIDRLCVHNNEKRQMFWNSSARCTFHKNRALTRERKRKTKKNGCLNEWRKSSIYRAHTQGDNQVGAFRAHPLE